jgi:hypothetical protein
MDIEKQNNIGNVRHGESYLVCFEVIKESSFVDSVGAVRKTVVDQGSRSRRSD